MEAIFNVGIITQFQMHTDASNNGASWERWMHRFENFLLAANIQEAERKTALLLHFAGEDVHDLYLSLPNATPNPAENPPPDTYLQAKRKLQTYFHPRVNQEFERFNFRKCSQQAEETLDQYYAKLLKLTKTCNFTNANAEIKSQIIMFTKYEELRRFGLSEQPNLEDLLSRGRTIEATKRQITAINQQTEEQSNRLRHVSKRNKHSSNNKYNGKSDFNKVRTDVTHTKRCNNCGNRWHVNGREACPAFGLSCNICHKKNHFASVCMSRRTTALPNSYRQATSSNNNYQHRRRHPVHPVNFNEIPADSSSSETSFALTMNNIKIPRVDIRLNGTPVRFVVDTGSSVNIISTETFSKLPKQDLLTPAATAVLPYNSTRQLEIIGKLQATLTYKSQQATVEILVVNGTGEALLSYETSRQLGLIQMSFQNQEIQQDLKYIEDKYPELCTGVGNLKNVKIKLHIDQEVQPVANKHRRIPFHLRERLEQELKRLEEQDIIEKATGQTPWVSPVVIVPKPNSDKLRICVDMREANKAIKRERHPTPTIDEIITVLNGATVFSKIDLNDGYHQLTIDESSRYITVFSTHIGLFRYKRLNFGINSAAEIFQNAISRVLSDINGVLNVSDDILIYGKSPKEHDKALEMVLQRLHSNNLTINKKKCVLNTKKIKFFGYVFSAEGVHPDPEKVQSVLNLKPPKDQHEMRSFLGILNYIGKFLPNLANNTEVLRKQLVKGVVWKWTDEHQEAFNNLKIQLDCADKLAYYDTTKPTHLIVDDSPHGLGAILSQGDRNNISIIAFGSRSLSDVEKRYSQIERETLAAVWAIQHFRTHLLGTTFTLHTDHKPLVKILINPKSSPSARIERMCLRIQEYSFTAKYQEGSSNPADYLSRYVQEVRENARTTGEDKIEKYVNFITLNSVPKLLTFQEIQNETKKDQTLTTLMTALTTDDYRLWKTPQLRRYKMFKDEISEHGGVLIRAHRIIIPSTLQQRVIELAHKGHQGVVKTKRLLRSKVWFPGIDELVEEFIKDCGACQVTTAHKQRDPIKTLSRASYPFEYADVDYAGPFPNGKYCFLLIDEFSKFPIIEVVPSTSFQHLKPVLDRTFALFGIVKQIQSDNGPPFNGTEIREYCEKLNIRHHRVTPEWPQANGLPERFVKTLKKALICSMLETSNMTEQLQLFLTNYRSTPHSTTNMSPYHLVFQREIKAFLPTIMDPKQKMTTYNHRFEEEKRKRNNERENKRRKVKIHDFEIGNRVLFKQKKKNALTPRYDPKPFTIRKIIGSQIHAERDEDRRYVIRNSSFFKICRGPLVLAQDDDKKKHVPITRQASQSSRVVLPITSMQASKRPSSRTPPERITMTAPPRPSTTTPQAVDGAEPFAQEHQDPPQLEIELPQMRNRQSPQRQEHQDRQSPPRQEVSAAPLAAARRSTRPRKPPRRYDDE